MNNQSLSPFEEKVRRATQMPEPKPEFVDALWNRTTKHQRPQPSTSAFGRFCQMLRRPAWYATAAILLVLIFTVLIVGPQRVYAAVRQLFGYIPGVGIVDQTAPIRVLAEPISITREGISLTVTSAVLTGDRTHIEYRIFGVPGSAYPDREDIAGCTQPEYLRLPDGTQLERTSDFPPVPARVNQAVFVLPCIPNTLPGKAPENWELPLRFVPAPPDLTVMPVIELSPSPQIQATHSPSASPAAGATGTLPVAMTGTPIASPDTSVTVDKVIETSDGYILVGEFHPKVQNGVWVQETGMPLIKDANGKKVSYSIAGDIATPGWAYQFKAAGLAFPLTITFSGVNISQADPQATANFEFDAGANPQPGQEWTPNQDIQLAGYTLKLVSITADSRNGYSFKFQTDSKVNSVGVDIAGYTPNGGGGGGGGGLTNGTFYVSISYAELPKGKLKVTLSHLTIIGDTTTWQGQWSPAAPVKAWPAAPTLQPGVCLTADSLDRLKPAPADLTGKVLLYEPLDAPDQWGIVLYNLDGSQKQVLVADASWGALSPDGSRMAYPGADGIHILDLATHTEQILKDASGFDLHWSPDGRQIAYVGGKTDNAYVINTDGSDERLVSDQSYEAVIGWSPDSAQIYISIPFTGGGAWLVRAVDAVTGAAHDLFTIENGSYKALNAALSPNGNWIAYRGRDNASLYLVRTDGKEMRLVMEKPSIGISGVEWSKSGWLGVSLGNMNTNDRTVVLVKPEDCQAYVLPALKGDLEGLYLP